MSFHHVSGTPGFLHCASILSGGGLGVDIAQYKLRQICGAYGTTLFFHFLLRNLGPQTPSFCTILILFICFFISWPIRGNAPF